MQPDVRNLFKTGILILLFLPAFYSCEDPFQYNPNEVLLEDDEKDLNAKNIAKIEALPLRDTLRFIVITDVHHAYSDFRDFVDLVNAESDIAFVAIAGDLTNFGLQTEFREMLGIADDLDIPFVSAIGNHDLLGNGSVVFQEMFGPLNFSFTCNRNKFICMDTNSREYNFNGKVPDLSWLNHEISENGYPGIFFISHVAPFDNDFDPALETGFTTALAESGNTKVSLHGHSNSFYQSDHYDDGILYQITENMDDRGYCLVTVWEEGYLVEEKLF